MEEGFALGCGLVKGRRQARRPFRSHQPPCTHGDDGKGSPVISLDPVAHSNTGGRETQRNGARDGVRVVGARQRARRRAAVGVRARARAPLIHTLYCMNHGGAIV